MQLSVVLVSVMAVAASAMPFSEIVKRSTTCGSTFFSTAQINAAANSACTHLRAGTTAGGSTYPHGYRNDEGFNFPSSGPYTLFPLRTSGVYNGGAPGADRVIIKNSNCALMGQITHTGASGNGFVGCSGTS